MDITKTLKRFNIIQPEGEFIARSKQLIFAMPQERTARNSWCLFFPILVGGIATASFLLVSGIYLIGLKNGNYFSRQVSNMGNFSALNLDKLNSEVQDLMIAINLNELEYRQSVERVVASALQEIGNDNVRHLNNSLLRKEAEDFNINSGQENGNEVEKLLEKVILGT